MGQHQALANSCLQLGLRVAHLPCLAIEPLDNNELCAELFNQTDSVLFTSKNSVLQAHRCCPLPWPDTIVNAIGPATAEALNALNQAVHLIPESPFTSESYLRQLVALPPQKLLIVKGAGGRTFIADQLRELGWSVQGIDVYRRILPDISPSSISDIILNSPPDLVSVTSNEALQNLKILAKEHWDILRKLPLVVNSQRAVSLAKSMGFEQHILVANQAGDEGQLEQIKLWMSSL